MSRSHHYPTISESHPPSPTLITMNPPEPEPKSRKFSCNFCDNSYNRLTHLKRHEISKHTHQESFSCPHCDKKFGRKDVRDKHIRTIHDKISRPTRNRDGPRPRMMITQFPGPVTPPVPVIPPVSVIPPVPVISPMPVISPVPVISSVPVTPSVASSSSTAPRYSIERSASLDQSQSASPGRLGPDNLFQRLMPNFQSMSSVPLPMTGLSSDFHPLISALSCLHSGQNTSQEVQPQVNRQGRCGKHSEDQTRKIIDDLIIKLSDDLHHTGVTPAFVEACLKEYFGRVSPCFPVIHEPTFPAQDCTPPLLLNMVALGSLFVCLPDSTRKGQMLWRLGHAGVATSWQTLIRLRGPKDQCDGVQLVLAALLGQIFAFLSSDPSIRTTAFASQGLGFYWAKISGMHMMNEFDMQKVPGLQADIATKDAAWRTWSAVEVQRRAVLGHYILDGLLSQASGSTTNTRHALNTIKTACSDAAFAAETADEWITEMLQLRGPPIPFSELFVKICAPDYATMRVQLSRFSTSVLLEGLQCLIAERYEVTSLPLGTVSRPQIIQGLLNIYETDLSTSHTIDSIQILIRWHAVCMELSTPTICLYRHICELYKIPQVLSGIPRGQTPLFELTTWSKSADAYRALLHAISIIGLVNEIPIGRMHALHLPGALFASAVVLIAIHIQNKQMVRIPKRILWHKVWDSIGNGSNDYRPGADQAGLSANPGEVLMTSVDLMHEVNFLRMNLRTISSRWWISAQMEEVIGRLVVLAT